MGKKGREKVPIQQRLQSAGGRDWSRARVLLLELPNLAGRAACIDPPGPLG